MSATLSACHSCALLRRGTPTCDVFPEGIPSRYIEDGDPHPEGYEFAPGFEGSRDAWQRLQGAETKHLPGQHDQRTHGRRKAPDTFEAAVQALLAAKKSGKRNIVQVLADWPDMPRDVRMRVLDEMFKRSRTPQEIAVDEETARHAAWVAEQADTARQKARDAEAILEAGEGPTAGLIAGTDLAEGDAFLSDRLVRVVKSSVGIEGVLFLTDDEGNRATVRRGTSAVREYAAEEFGRQMGFDAILTRSYLRANARPTYEPTGKVEWTPENYQRGLMGMKPDPLHNSDTGAGAVTNVREWVDGETVAYATDEEVGEHLHGEDYLAQLIDRGRIGSDEQDMLSQLDYLTAAGDRHLNNMVVADDDRLIAIDNTDTWIRGVWVERPHHSREAVTRTDWDRADKALDAVAHLLEDGDIDRARRRISEGRRGVYTSRWPGERWHDEADWVANG